MADRSRERAGAAAAPGLSSAPLQDRLRDKRVCICVGAGGVGKTTIAAATAMGLAARGQKVAVITIDPAARLAGALGLRELAAEPVRIEPPLLAAAGIELAGELWAMTLDTKRTFDEIVTRLAPDARAREEILANPIYRELSSAVAGSQELSAVAKLYELRYERDFDVIVLDTPPSRNAVDFIEAPTRLLGFLDGRALRVFLAPGGLAARLFGRSTGLVFAIFARVTGVDMFADLSRFFRSLSGVIDGFGDRTRAVAELLRDPSTAFMILTSAEPEAAREAAFLARRISAAGMSRGAVIVNRVQLAGIAADHSRALEPMLARELGEPLAARVVGNLADFELLAQRDHAVIARLQRELSEGGPILVPHLDEDVKDLASVAALSSHLFT